jgi:hypothetical protein
MLTQLTCDPRYEMRITPQKKKAKQITKLIVQ